MESLPSKNAIEKLLEAIVPLSSQIGSQDWIEHYNNVLKVSSEYINHPTCALHNRIILLAAEYQHRFMGVNLQLIKGLYGNFDESANDDLLKQVHRKIIEMFYSDCTLQNKF